MERVKSKRSLEKKLVTTYRPTVFVERQI